VGGAEETAGELMVALRNSVYAVGGVIGVFIASSWLLRASKRPSIGVRGSSDGSGEKGEKGDFEAPPMRPWPLVMRGLRCAGILLIFFFFRIASLWVFLVCWRCTEEVANEG
jgi:hypothetical protein